MDRVVGNLAAVCGLDRKNVLLRISGYHGRCAVAGDAVRWIACAVLDDVSRRVVRGNLPIAQLPVDKDGNGSAFGREDALGPQIGTDELGKLATLGLVGCDDDGVSGSCDEIGCDGGYAVVGSANSRMWLGLGCGSIFSAVGFGLSAR